MYEGVFHQLRTIGRGQTVGPAYDDRSPITWVELAPLLCWVAAICASAAAIWSIRPERLLDHLDYAGLSAAIFYGIPWLGVLINGWTMRRTSGWPWPSALFFMVCIKPLFAFVFLFLAGLTGESLSITGPILVAGLLAVIQAKIFAAGRPGAWRCFIPLALEPFGLFFFLLPLALAGF